MSEEAKEHQKCVDRLNLAVVQNFKVRKLVDSIEELGCKIPSDFFICRPCEGEIAGGFVAANNGEAAAAGADDASYVPHVVLCENKKRPDESYYQRTIIHELVHAYDVCRSKLDFTMCQQHACTEIRASAISGECGFFQARALGYRNFNKGKQDCVKDRATVSVSSNPNCKGMAAALVESVFDRCYNDILPFAKEDLEK